MNIARFTSDDNPGLAVRCRWRYGNPGDYAWVSRLARANLMVTIRFRLDFAPGGSVGPGKIDLLAAIEAEGSLSAAARQVGMSYRRAWLLLDSLNATFDEPVTSANVGGLGGGGVTLTPFGRDLVRCYRDFEREIATLAARRWGRLKAAGGTRRARAPERSARSAQRPLRPRLRKPGRSTKRP
jgi:molybdate transport system regulatory protein